METALFWIFWGIISFWTLKTFYYSSSKQQLERLRKTALGIQLGVLMLTLLPWLPASPAGGPPTLGEKSGLILALEGNVLAVLFLIVLVTSTILFLTKTSLHLKIASGMTMINTLVLFVLMTQLRPDTFTLSLFDIAPIIAMFMLLVENVVVLLLWQQLQLLEKKSKSNARQTKSFLTVASIVLLATLTGGWMILKPLKASVFYQENRIETVAELAEVIEFKKSG